MKKGTVAFVAVLLACFMVLSAGAGSAEGNHPSRIILYTAYRQVGWDDVVQVGCVDEDGRLWLLSSTADELQNYAQTQIDENTRLTFAFVTAEGTLQQEFLLEVLGSLMPVGGV